MKAKHFIIIFLIGLMACQPAERDADTIKKEIAGHRAAIAELEKELHQIDDGKEADRRILINVKTLTHEAFKHHFEASGTAEAVQAAFISPEMGGQIKHIYVKEGQRVTRGQTLVVLNISQLSAGIEEAKTALKLATTMYEKQKKLWEQGVGTEIQYLQAKNQKESIEKKINTLQAQMGSMVITAPISGEVDEIHQKAGELASPGRELLRLFDLSEMYVNIKVSESYLSSFKQGDMVEVYFPAYDSSRQAVIHRVGNYIDPGDRTFQVELKLKNPDKSIKPNMMAKVMLSDYETKDALLVPSIIIQKDMKGRYLYIVDEKDGKVLARKVYVQTGLSDDRNTIVESGLKAGDRVIVAGYNQVRDGSIVRIEEKSK